MRHRFATLPLIAIFVTSLYREILSQRQEEELTISVEDVETTSDVFSVRLFVEGLTIQQWIPMGTFIIEWQPEELELVSAEKDPSTAEVNTQLFMRRGEDNRTAVLSILCDLACDGAINPEFAQPIAIMTFRVLGVAAIVETGLLHDLTFPGSPTIHTVVQVQGAPVRPTMLESGVVSIERFRRGDVDQNSAVELTDAVTILTFLFLGDPDSPCKDPADVDDNGNVNISDAIYLLMHLFLEGMAPPEPTMLRGLDSTPDDLHCRA